MPTKPTGATAVQLGLRRDITMVSYTPTAGSWTNPDQTRVNVTRYKQWGCTLSPKVAELTPFLTPTNYNHGPKLPCRGQLPHVTPTYGPLHTGQRHPKLPRWLRQLPPGGARGCPGPPHPQQFDRGRDTGGAHNLVGAWIRVGGRRWAVWRGQAWPLVGGVGFPFLFEEFPKWFILISSNIGMIH